MSISGKSVPVNAWKSFRCPTTTATNRKSTELLCFGSYTVLQNSVCVFLQVAQIVKHEMENAVKLSVKLNVKVKIGPSWGDLQDLEL